MPETTIRTAVDAYARQNLPNENYGNDRKLKLRGSATSQESLAYLFFNRPFPHNATVRSATLYLTLAGTWSSNTLKARRVQAAWVENRLKWTNRPDTSATHETTETGITGSDGTVVEVDVTDILNDVAHGDSYFGIRLALSQDNLREVYSAEATNSTKRPYMVVDWGAEPYPPEKLAPSGGLAVSVTKPVLNWKFVDNRGDTTQAYSQVQISNSSSFASPLYDTGKVANQQSKWDTTTVGATTDWTGISAGQTRWWRVKVWDGTNFESGWSDTVTFTKVSKPTLELVNPPAAPDNYVEETTPPISWTLTGGTQERAEVHLWKLNASGAIDELLQSWTDETTDTSVVVAKNQIKTGKTYRVRVRVWDDENRAVTPGDPDYLQVTQDFTYERSGSPAAVDSLDYESNGGKVVLTWTRTLQPDHFSLRVDDEEVEQRIDPDEFLTDAGPPAEYQMNYWGLRPGHEAVVEIEAVVNDAGVRKHSDGNPTITVEVPPRGAYLVDVEEDKYVEFFDMDDPNWEIGESSVTLHPIGSRSPVRITDNIRGREGTISGLIIGRGQRDNLLEMKEDFREYRLIMGDENFPVTLEEVSCPPSGHPGAEKFNATVSFFQSGEFGSVVKWRA